jgi:hypothetical protein
MTPYRIIQTVCVALIIACTVALLVMISASPASAAQACLAAPSTDDYYQYRLIGGKKCWYRGRAVLEKSVLYWRNPVRTSVMKQRAMTVPDVEPASRLAAGRTADATEVVGRDSPERRAPDFDATFAHFPTYAVARPVVHLLYPTRVAQAWGSKRVAVVVYRKEQ